ncbi:hypothetical protein GW17_00048643 [Ensete ventricosum]|nr:hypothetical protein GW17_00048643 [Ensete ventricosum]
MNQRFDDVHKTLRTKDERGKSPLCGSPFIQEIQDVSILQHFHLPMLEAYDGSSDPMEHVAAFHVQMALYGMSNAIMCWAFSTTLRGIARGWYDRLPPSSIHSFDQLAREFEVNFLASVRPKPTTTSLLRMRQREDEHLGRYLAHFTEEIRVIPDMHPLLIVDLIHRGHLDQHIMKSCKPSLRLKGLVERQVDIIVGGPAAGGVSSSIRKAYARAEVQKSPRAQGDPGITFESESEYPDQDDT